MPVTEVNENAIANKGSCVIPLHATAAIAAGPWFAYIPRTFVGVPGLHTVPRIFEGVPRLHSGFSKVSLEFGGGGAVYVPDRSRRADLRRRFLCV
jgi:hypothetical protein